MTTAARLYAAIAARYPSASAAADALNVSKQALAIARQRGTMFDDVCIRACALLGLDAAPTLAALHRDTADSAAARAVWDDIYQRLNKTPNNGSDAPENPDQQPDGIKHNDAGIQIMRFTMCDLHGMRSLKNPRIEQAERLVRWMLCIPKISPTSPRFDYYARYWNVLDKIRRFAASGELDSMLQDSPAFSAEELRAALDFIDRSETVEKPRKTTATKSISQVFA